MVPGVEKINAANIPVVNITDRIAGGNFVAFVGADDYNSRSPTARYLFKAMGGKGNVVILEGVQGLAHQRRPRARLQRRAEGVSEREAARLAARQLPAAAGAAGDGEPDAVVPADRRRAGRQRRHGGRRDRGAGGRQSQGAGDRHQRQPRRRSKRSRPASCSPRGDYNGFIQGCLGTEIAMRHLRKQPIPKEIILKPVVIDKSQLPGLRDADRAARVPEAGGRGDAVAAAALIPELRACSRRSPLRHRSWRSPRRRSSHRRSARRSAPCPSGCRRSRGCRRASTRSAPAQSRS